MTTVSLLFFPDYHYCCCLQARSSHLDHHRRSIGGVLYHLLYLSSTVYIHFSINTINQTDQKSTMSSSSSSSEVTIAGPSNIKSHIDVSLRIPTRLEYKKLTGSYTTSHPKSSLSEQVSLDPHSLIRSHTLVDHVYLSKETYQNPIESLVNSFNLVEYAHYPNSAWRMY